MIDVTNVKYYWQGGQSSTSSSFLHHNIVSVTFLTSCLHLGASALSFLFKSLLCISFMLCSILNYTFHPLPTQQA